MSQEVLLERLTRREFRERLQRGELQAAIIATGSIEQHLEHLPFAHDTLSAAWVAEQVARQLFPKVIVTVPVSIGISEHWMWAPGTLTAKPGSWLAVLFDAAESLMRHGLRKVLILNGHAGNVAPVQGVLRQWQLYFARQFPDSNLQFASYWDFIPRDLPRRCWRRNGCRGTPKSLRPLSPCMPSPNSCARVLSPIKTTPNLPKRRRKRGGNWRKSPSQGSSLSCKGCWMAQ
jgi:hypothetical protein